MSNVCFISQEATQAILLRVTNVCAECYDDLHEGDIIHYDVQNFRYICKKCQESLCARMNEACEVTEEENPNLFC